MRRIQVVGDLAKGFSDVDPTVQRAVVALGLIVGAAGPALLAIGQLVNLTTSSMTGIAALGTKLGASFAGIGGAAEVGAMGAALGTLATLAIPAIAAITGVALAWHQLQTDTAGLHSLDAPRQQLLASGK